MKIMIWGTGHLSRLIEDYIRKDIQIVAYVDNNKIPGGGIIKTFDRTVTIMLPNDTKNLEFDYCLIAVEHYQEILLQCLHKLNIPDEKILIVPKMFEWNKDLLLKIFNENIYCNPRDYTIQNIKVDLGENHALPLYQKRYKMYDRFIPYLAQITQKKEGKCIIDIGANVGDTLVGMWKHTEDRFYCIEPVTEFFNLLTDNAKRLGNMERVCLEQAFITDNMEENYQAIVSDKGTASKIRTDENIKSIPSKTVDYLIAEKGIRYDEVDLLKIDTDGFDADCIISAKELLEESEALIFWENYNETCEQYQKYLEAYQLLDKKGYFTFFVFDNYGNYLCRGGLDTIHSILDYMQRVNTDCIGNTFHYFDVLACKEKDVKLCERLIMQFLDNYPLFRIS